MKTTIYLPNEWLSVEYCGPERAKIYLVKCEHGFVSTGWFTGGDDGYWWVFDREKGEYHPNQESDPVTHFSELPKMGIFSGEEKK